MLWKGINCHFIFSKSAFSESVYALIYTHLWSLRRPELLPSPSQGKAFSRSLEGVSQVWYAFVSIYCEANHKSAVALGSFSLAVQRRRDRKGKMCAEVFSQTVSGRRYLLRRAYVNFRYSHKHWNVQSTRDGNMFPGHHLNTHITPDHQQAIIRHKAGETE